MSDKYINVVVAIYVLCGALTSLLLALAVIVFPVVIPLFRPDYEVPTEIRNWGGVIIGFYFGSFATLAAEWIKGRRDSRDEVAGQRPSP